MTLVMRLKKKFYFLAANYFRFFANISLRRWKPRVIAITGSVGKTTMLNLVESTLKTKAHYSFNANSAFGVAFDIVDMDGVHGSKWRWLSLIIGVPFKSLFYTHREKFYIVEIDGERPHEAEFLAKWLKPEVTIWVSLGLSHAVQFEKQVEAGIFPNLEKAITHEFATLPENTQKLILIDKDVDLMNRAIDKIVAKGKTKAEVIKCSKGELLNYTVYPNKTEFVMNFSSQPKLNEFTITFKNPMQRDLAIQLSMLSKLCEYLHIQIPSDFSDMREAPGRNTFLKGINNLKIIDSSYNAHLISMESILKMYRSMRTGHKWLVIGDMVEQGSIEQHEHEKLADAIIASEPEQVILIGRRTHEYTYPILKKQGIKVNTFDDPKQALEFIQQNAVNGETILFKGSQYLEWIIEKLLLNSKDAERLPRREKAAEKRREKRGLN